ncbi:quinolinate synthase NadA [Vallitalea guaymasensis]|uniref:Quinolinate synthase n=1 Tax=Vallitalea guaymasensis TaxID=1185412 RepID=A0A8J8SEC7_9FIRM|nr:quinolinate synthase NadA [Vallitalea guaymasensis]QUH31747.1 quinolinate synthase NadA [Vallitalea guaymasensis]
MKENLKAKLIELKKEKNAVILAHNYQLDEIQEVADYIGDSLALSKIAMSVKEDVIVFCGVKFMAETAKILSPDKKVILPVIEAGCPMADMVTAEELRNVKKDYPEAAVVCYVNSSAEVKAESDICCTSSNAINVVDSIKSDQILFVPDQNLGSYVAEQIKDKEVILWQGFCIVHNRVTSQNLLHIKEKYQFAPVLVHPECRPEIVEQADFIGSTSEIIREVKKLKDKKIIIGTEKGILYTLKKQNPDKDFILLSEKLTCMNMKKTTLKDVISSLENETNIIEVDESVRKKAYDALKKMILL